MGEKLRVATRKGLFTLKRERDRWTIGEPAFLGDPVSMMLDDPRDGTLYAALNLGHFGVKLRRSRDDGATWEELEGPVYPPQPEGAEGSPWKLVQIWALEPGTKDEPGVLWAGTIPGRTLPLRRSRHHLAPDPIAVGSARTPAVGAAAATITPASIPSSSTRATASE